MYKQINFINPELKLSSNLAIVGSSGRLNNSKKGNYIDSFDDVVRFNTAITKGYEEDAGSRTTLRAVNNVVFDNNNLKRSGYSKSPKNFMKKLRNQKVLFIGPHLKPWINRDQNSHKSNELFLYDYEMTSKIKELMDCHFEQNLQIGTIFIGLSIISGIKPTIFGFDLEQESRTHYYQDRPKNVNNLTHNPYMEQIAIKNLINQDMIEYII